MRVGLVLGAGGILGGAWLTGGLKAIAQETGWDPASAELIVGTSAGSVVGGLLAGGVPPWLMVAHTRGETFEGLVDAAGEPAEHADRSGGGRFTLHRGLPLPGPGSWRLVLSSLARPTRHTPLAMTAGWMPRGIFSTEPIKEVARRVAPAGWVDHPGYRAVACDYSSGRRVAFGEEGAPSADLGDAVAASCAIPGFYRPVRIAGRRYVDGGVRSTSNLDLVAGRELDLVICLNPTSSLEAPAARSPLNRMASASRAASGRRLGHEAKRVRRDGTEVLLIQPEGDDLAAMGNNLMDGRRRVEAVDTAERTVARALRAPDVAALTAGLPEGPAHAIARPDGPPATWPDILGRRAAA